MSETVNITYRYRVKDKHSAYLNAMARKVNFVWNYCNDTQKHALKWAKKWPSHFDLTYLTSGSSIDIGLPATSIAEVCKKYVQSRRSNNKPYLRYRGKKSLGWVPFRAINFKLADKGFQIYRNKYSVWLSRKIPENAKICDGSSFSQDSRGRWYLNVVLEIPAPETAGCGKVGIDLGLKDLATLSTGEKIAAPRYYRRTQERLATAQRARKKRQVTKIHAKIGSQRKDFLHKVSTNIVRQNNLIIVGNVNSSKLAKTRMAKSVSDAGWSSLRNMIAYKSIANGARYIEVNESFTTQTCSDCGVISGPKGRKGLGVREWECACGSVHDRDVNSALNIARLGLQTLTGAVI